MTTTLDRTDDDPGRPHRECGLASDLTLHLTPADAYKVAVALDAIHGRLQVIEDNIAALMRRPPEGERFK